MNVQTEQTLNHQDLLKILPHRYPFLLVDKIIEINKDEKTILGQKNCTLNEPFFQGHFPDMPIMPGVLIIEALAQTGGIYIHSMGYRSDHCYLVNINNAKFRSPVFPGDVLTLKVEERHLSNKGGKFLGIAMVGEKVAAQAEFSCVLVDNNSHQ